MKKNFNRRSVLLSFLLFIVTLAVVMVLPEKRKQFKTGHFSFRFSEDIDTNKIKELAIYLEDNYSKISNHLKTIPAPDIEVNIYAQRWKYIRATGNWAASGNIEGIAKLHFVEQAWGESDAKKTAVHEFTHAVVLKLLLDREQQPLDSKAFENKFAGLPVWLWEATSVYEAAQFKDPKTMPFLSGGTYPSLSELNSRSKGGKIYNVGYILIEYILHQYSQDKLIELIANYGDVQKVLNVTAEEFSKGWYDFINTKYLL